MKRFQKITGGFLFPEKDELGSIKGDDIICIFQHQNLVQQQNIWPGFFNLREISKTFGRKFAYV